MVGTGILPEQIRSTQVTPDEIMPSPGIVSIRQDNRTGEYIIKTRSQNLTESHLCMPEPEYNIKIAHADYVIAFRGDDAYILKSRSQNLSTKSPGVVGIPDAIIAIRQDRHTGEYIPEILVQSHVDKEDDDARLSWKWLVQELIDARLGLLSTSDRRFSCAYRKSS